MSPQQCVLVYQGLKISYWILYYVIPCNDFTFSLEGYCAFTEGGFNLHIRFLKSSSLGIRELLAESRWGTFAALLATRAPETFAVAANVFDNRGGLSDALTLILPFVSAFPCKPCCWCIPVRVKMLNFDLIYLYSLRSWRDFVRECFWFGFVREGIWRLRPSFALEILPATQAIISRKSVPSRSLSSLADEQQNQQLQFDMFRLKDNIFIKKRY